VRRRIFAWTFLALTVYGLIAVARVPIAWFFRETLPQLASFPRYHYAGTIPVVLLLAEILGRMRWVVARPSWLGWALPILWAGVIAVLWFGAPRIDHHDAARAEVARVLSTIHRLIDAVPPGGDVYIRNQTLTSVLIRGTPRMIFPGWVGLFVVTEPENVVRGRHIHFVESDPAVLAARLAWPGRRTAALLVGPGEVKHTGF
jgi:hypothetical protein